MKKDWVLKKLMLIKINYTDSLLEYCYSVIYDSFTWFAWGVTFFFHMISSKIYTSMYVYVSNLASYVGQYVNLKSIFYSQTFFTPNKFFGILYHTNTIYSSKKNLKAFSGVAYYTPK